MSLESMMEAMSSLLVITAINGIVVCSITFAYLIVRDKLAKRRRDLMRRVRRK
jgi:hypothetical protein